MSDYEDGRSPECPVCLESYDHLNHLPKMMSPCLHTTCFSCVMQLVQEHQMTSPSEGEEDPEADEQDPEPPSLPEPNPHAPPIYATPARVRSRSSDHNNNGGSSSSGGRNNPPLIQRLIGGRTRIGPPPVPPSLGNNQRISQFLGGTPGNPRRGFRPPMGGSSRQGTNSRGRNPLQGAAAAAVPITVEIRKELPREVEFKCPMCRTKINTTQVQTNRYIIAHLKYLEANPGPPPGSSKGRASGLIGLVTSMAREPPLPKQIPAPRDDWCNDCCSPAETACGEHERLPLTVWNARQGRNMRERAQGLRQRVKHQQDNLNDLEDQTRDLQDTLNLVISKLTSSRQQCTRLSGTLDQLLHDCDHIQDQAHLGEADRVDQLRSRALMFKDQARTLHELKAQVSRLEGGGPDADSTMLWNSEKKLYIKGLSSIFSIVKENENYLG